MMDNIYICFYCNSKVKPTSSKFKIVDKNKVRVCLKCIELFKEID